MKKFIKENWFKVILVFVALIFSIAIFYYFVIFLPRENVIEYQDKQKQENAKQLIMQQQNCSSEASKAYKELGYSSNDIGSSYTNHWNERLSRCLMEIQNSTSPSGTLMTSKDLSDVLEGKEFASFTVIRDKKLWEQKPVLCEMYPDGKQDDVKFCNSEAEFDAFVSSYLNE